MRGQEHPAWAKNGAVFALDGETFRIRTCGSSNKVHYPHYSATVGVERVDAAPWTGLPDAPCPVADVSASLQALFRLRQIEAKDLARAIHTAPLCPQVPR